MDFKQYTKRYNKQWRFRCRYQSYFIHVCGFKGCRKVKKLGLRDEPKFIYCEPEYRKTFITNDHWVIDLRKLRSIE